jgi:hypothetical protein
MDDRREQGRRGSTRPLTSAVQSSMSAAPALSRIVLFESDLIACRDWRNQM